MRDRMTWLLAPLATLVLLGLGLAVTVVVPAVGEDLGGTTTMTPAVSKESQRGHAVYVAEGCVYCHTQQVRPVSNDLGLGMVTRADWIARQDPPVIGVSRIGPDLACYGDRALQPEQLTSYLRDPAAAKGYSRMPGFGSLSGAQMKDLVSYLESLTCGEKR